MKLKLKLAENSMIEIRFHGRGGQGAVIASKILAAALFKEGKHAQAFPAFGGERRGAPVMAFTRFDKKTITRRSMVYEPDHVVILDESILEVADVTSGLKEGGWILINTPKPSFGLSPIPKIPGRHGRRQPPCPGKRPGDGHGSGREHGNSRSVRESNGVGRSPGHSGGDPGIRSREKGSEFGRRKNGL